MNVVIKIKSIEFIWLVWIWVKFRSVFSLWADTKVLLIAKYVLQFLLIKQSDNKYWTIIAKYHCQYSLILTKHLLIQNSSELHACEIKVHYLIYWISSGSLFSRFLSSNSIQPWTDSNWLLIWKKFVLCFDMYIMKQTKTRNTSKRRTEVLVSWSGAYTPWSMLTVVDVLLPVAVARFGFTRMVPLLHIYAKRYKIYC